MNKQIGSILFFFALIAGVYSMPRHVWADVNPSDVNSVMNGLVTQQSINQVKKPQFSDGNGTSDIIDPASGSLTWKQNSIHLPGRDGLDVNVGVMYQSNQAFNYMKIYTAPGLKKFNYLNSRYDLGVGWSFQFPSIQVADGGYLYYHRGDGAVYRIDFEASDAVAGVTHLLGYEGKNLRLNQDTQGLFNNGQAQSAYYLEYANKKREYFATDGRLLGIVDRYGNTITFQHVDRQEYDGQTYKVISSITDSVGRVVSFTYDSKLQMTGTFDGENITVTVKDPSGNQIETVVYTKWRASSTYNGNPDGYFPYLWSISNQKGTPTYLYYNWNAQSYFNYSTKSRDSYSGFTPFYLLDKVQYSNSVANYQHEMVTRNFGPGGFTEEYRVIKRYDQLMKGSFSATGDYNHTNITYTGDYTGYPAYYDTNNLPAGYTYSNFSKVQSTTPTNGLETITNFNGLGQIVSTETKAANGERQVDSVLTYHSTFTSLPTLTQHSEYGAGDTDSTANKLLVEKTYSDWGGLSSETKPLTQAQRNDANVKKLYTTTYVYEPTYNFVKTKTWYQNPTTMLTETSDYYSSGRLKSFTNAKNEVTNYCYDGVDGISNCTNAATAVNGNISKVRVIKNLGNGKTSTNEVLYGSVSNFAYPIQSDSYFTTKGSTGTSTVTQDARKTFVYDVGTGLLKEESDGLGNKTSYTYDSLKRVTRISYPTFTNLNNEKYDVFDELSYSESTYVPGSDPENANLYSTSVSSDRKYVRKSDGAQTFLSNEQFYYDGFGFLRYDVKQNNGQAIVTQYRPDDMTREIYRVDPMSNMTTVTYGPWGELKESADTYGNLYVTENNLKLRRNISYFVAADQVSTYRTNPADASAKSSYVEQDYDQWRHLLTTRTYKDWPNTSQPISELYAYDIEGNVVAYTDPKRNLNNEGVTTKYSYDALDQPVAVKDALGQITTYKYDGNGQVVSIAMQANESSAPSTLKTKDFNEIGGLATKTDATANLETYAYNSLGLLEWNTDRNGSKFAYHYDEHYRNDSVTLTNGSSSQQKKTIFGNSGILSDRTLSFKNGVQTEQMDTVIDQQKRVTSINKQGTGGYSSGLALSYDANDRVSSLTSSGPSNIFVTNYKYSGLRLDKVQVDGLATVDNTQGKNVQYAYYANGQVKSITYPTLADATVLATNYVYDKLNRQDTVTNQKGSAILSQFRYSYDDNGNIISITQTITGQGTRNNNYKYDKLNRLSIVTRWDGSTASYNYDLKGNRLTLSDTAGLPLGIESEATYKYDLFNTLTIVTKGGVATSFDYSPDGLRYKKASGSNVTQYRYNPSGQVVAEMNGSNQTTATYVRGDRLLVKKDLAAAKDYYYLYNGHGDVIQIVDTSGQVINSYSYDEWGTVTQQTGGLANSFKYAGEIQDSETGLYYLRARYYDSTVGRFINEDTYEGQINNPLSLNLYTYVMNNPLIYVDPTGNYCVSADGKYAHAGVCDNGAKGSIYMGDDQYIPAGTEIIENGKVKGYMGVMGPPDPKGYGSGNFWDIHPIFSVIESASDNFSYNSITRTYFKDPFVAYQLIDDIPKSTDQSLVQGGVLTGAAKLAEKLSKLANIGLTEATATVSILLFAVDYFTNKHVDHMKDQIKKIDRGGPVCIVTTTSAYYPTGTWVNHVYVEDPTKNK
ncbi:RHS repeat-associated core domain-containing protein [Paenibacillus sp. CF384]|uniref:RHS repeat domain-containing protein n=1 Tax=Paenibacillus sp. CF384 TaxID=1884382 RepID=UPI0008948B46|nr:RHS repeat-associated core domain-containing protein [Paenibacillus sp. CF384]SDW76863.1 RHS repeat-associated core domain-containing protein [Paenibacillus sp. CF384]